MLTVPKVLTTKTAEIATRKRPIAYNGVQTEGDLSLINCSQGNCIGIQGCQASRASIIRKIKKIVFYLFNMRFIAT